jgi:hypothetical protein
MSGIRNVAFIAGVLLVALPTAALANGKPAGAKPSAPIAALAGGSGSGRTSRQNGSGACRSASLTGFVIPRKNGRQGDVGFYLGGANTNCALSALHPKTASKWVGEQVSKGRSLAPLWVGPQAPCAKGHASSIDVKSRNNARRQGEDAADAAVSAASELGLGKGPILYYDMGNYDASKLSCQGAVAAFLGGWNYEIHSRGYKAGLYTPAAPAKAVRKSLRILIPELQPDSILIAR